MLQCPTCSGPANFGKDDCPYLISAYVLAGFAMMLNIRLSYSSAPYALIRFQLPENLFSVFVRRMASALELWCLPSMALGNIMDLGVKGAKPNDRPSRFKWITVPSILTQWLNFLTYLILLIVYVSGTDHGHLTTFYWVIAISGFVFGINMTLVYASDFNYLVYYIAGENCFPILTSFIHYLTTLIFGNRRKYNSDFLIVKIDIWVAIIISFGAAVVWTLAYGIFTDTAGDGGTGREDYGHIFASSFDTRPPKINLISPCLMVIVGMGLVYAIYPGIAPGMIVPFYLVDKIEMVLLILTTFPPLIIAILRKTKPGGGSIYTPQAIWGEDEQNQYSEPPKYINSGDEHTGKDGSLWHIFDLLIVIKISLAAIFICCLHYRDSNLSRSIVNQPKMSTALSITFYMCHECLLAIGFPGIFGGNNGGDYIMLPTQYVGALFMIFLAFYSDGYIIEYKSHDPQHWPTEGMTPWNAFCYWTKIASKITNHNLRSLFMTCLKIFIF